MELTSSNSESCIFKILPRYKVRSVGDDVRFNDQVKFESVKTEGQFLHCSAQPYRGAFPVLAQWSVTSFTGAVHHNFVLVMYLYSYELNLSASESALTVVSHYRPMPTPDPKALRVHFVKMDVHRNCINFVVISFAHNTSSQGGEVVRLFHREKECYVSAEGSFADSKVVVEDGNEK